MNHLSFLLKTLSVLRDHQPWKLTLIFIISMINGLSAGFSIVLLIPLLQLLNVSDGEQLSDMALFFKNMASKTGLELNIETILAIYLFLLTLMPLLAYWNSLLDSKYQ